MRRRQRAGGFTLIEIMLVLGIMGLLTMIMWSSFSQAVRSKRRVEAAQERTHTVRVALLRMAREIEMAYIADRGNDVQMARTRLYAKSHADFDELTFSAFAHQRLRADVAEGDSSDISYFGERDPDDKSIMNLMRRETRRLQAVDPRSIPGETYVLCPDVVSFKVQYRDQRKKEWVDEWDTMVAGSDYLPTHVRVTLTVLDENGREMSYSTDARIQITEYVRHMLPL
jgi:general secretion pathway protein J